MNDQPNRDVVVFTEAILLPASERAGYLERICGGDAKLRERVEVLLQTYDEVGDFLEQSPPPAAIETKPGTSAGEKAGDRIGRYKLLQQIGEGGCGVVYMAEQEEPVRRRVALKIIKPGMDTKSVIARFEAERQALALMDHPSIAKVFDAGATESGRPYFVMELIRGIKITEYCDQNSLTTRERLNLFVEVCQAVQHAHQKGIIHRDIKPSNILVTTTLEGAALPVVIDFGIAKATTNQRLTDKTLFTAFEMLIGTPAYMSPEQAAMTSVDVDTRSDIYSLGVLLYELLTGSTPFDAGELLKAGLDEIRKVIREQEPVRPSTRLSKLTGADLTTVAQHRKSEPPKLIRTICGDLDWIAMKALEKDRTRRYETANGFALDIQHFLNNETISARPPSTLYRFQKTVSRNRLLFGSIGVVVLLLVVSLVMISASLAKERRARLEMDAALKQAEADQAKSSQITQLLEDMLKGVGPSAARGRDTTMLREVLDNTAERIGKELTNQPVVEAKLRTIIGAVYSDLGEYEKAEIMDRAALRLYRNLSGNESLEVAASLSQLAKVLLKRGKTVEGDQLFREALAIRQKVFGLDHLDVAASLRDLAGAVWKEGKWDEAEALNRQSLEMRRKRLGTDYDLGVADTLNFQAMVLLRQGKLPEAESTVREVLAIRKKLLGENDPGTVDTLLMLSMALGFEGKAAEAVTLTREVLTQRRKLLGDYHPSVAACLSNLGLLLQQQGLSAEAESAFREAVMIQRKALGGEHPDTIYSLNNLALTLERRRNFAEAESLGREILALRRKVYGEEHLDVAASLNTLARVLDAEGKPTEAELLNRQALALLRKTRGNEDPDVADALNNLMGRLTKAKKINEIEPLLNEFLTTDFIRKPESASFLKARAEHLARRGRWKEAAADMSLAVKYKPDDHQYYHMLVPLLVETHDQVQYQLLCQKILTKFAGTTDAFVADRMAKDCLILPASGVDLRLVNEMAETAITRGKNQEALPFFQCCKGLAEYRQGHFPGAIEWAQKALKKPYKDVQGMAYPILAMAHFQLGHNDEARSALAKGTELVQDIPKRGSDDLGADWQGWIFTQVLADEATAMIKPTSTLENSPKKP